MGRWAWAITVVVGLLLSPGVRAESPLETARNEYRSGRLRACITILRTMETDPSLTEAQQVDLYWLRGIAHHALGQLDEATKSFDALLELQPMYQPDLREASPSVRSALAIRAEMFQKRWGLRVAGVEVAGAAFRINVAQNPMQVRAGVLYARPRGRGAFRQLDVDFTGNPTLVPVVDRAFWEQAGTNGGAEWVLEAKMPSGAVLTRVNDALRPGFLALSPLALDAVREALNPAPAVAKPDPLPPLPEPASLPVPAEAALPASVPASLPWAEEAPPERPAPVAAPVTSPPASGGVNPVPPILGLGAGVTATVAALAGVVAVAAAGGGMAAAGWVLGAPSPRRSPLFAPALGVAVAGPVVAGALVLLSAVGLAGAALLGGLAGGSLVMSGG